MAIENHTNRARSAPSINVDEPGLAVAKFEVVREAQNWAQICHPSHLGDENVTQGSNLGGQEKGVGLRALLDCIEGVQRVQTQQRWVSGCPAYCAGA